ncbi:hypothetical protein [Tolypothrix sp. VBCCA 56010]
MYICDAIAPPTLGAIAMFLSMILNQVEKQAIAPFLYSALTSVYRDL